MDFAKRLKNLRKEHQMNQHQLGKYLNLAESTVSLYESGKREPDYGTLLQISRAFGASLDYLFGVTDIRSVAHYEYSDQLPFLTDQHFLEGSTLYLSAGGESEGEDETTAEKSSKFWYTVNHSNASSVGILPGDLLLVDLAPDDFEIGDRVLVLPPKDDQLRICQVIQWCDPTILMPADSRQKPMVLTAKSRNKLPVLGKILELQRRYLR